VADEPEGVGTVASRDDLDLFAIGQRRVEILKACR